MSKRRAAPQSPVNLVARRRAALAASTRARPALAEAVQRMREGDGAGAAKALAELDDPRARHLATGLLERLGARLGVAPEAIRAVGLALVRDLKSGAVDELSSVGFLWDEGWSAEVLGLVHPKRLSEERQGGYAAGRLLAVVKVACDAGDLDTAAQRAGAIDAYHKDTRALALCALGAASSGKTRDGYLLDAVKAAKGDSMIENGGEESSALGRVVEQLAALVPADHPAAEAACKALLALGKKRVKNDVRSYGLARAASAAARTGDRAWLARAGALIEAVHTGQLTWAPLLLTALAHRAAGQKKAEAAALARIPDAAWLGEARVRALYPERAALLTQHWERSPSPFGDIALIRAAGGDASDRIEAAIEEKREWSGGLESAYAELVSIDAEIAARVLGEVDEPETAHHEAADSLEMDGRIDEARAHFVKALDLGLRGAMIAQHERILADRALRERVEARVKDEPDLDDRAAAMSDVAELWWRDGEIERAIACIGLLAIAPPGEKEG